MRIPLQEAPYRMQCVSPGADSKGKCLVVAIGAADQVAGPRQANPPEKSGFFRAILKTAPPSPPKLPLDAYGYPL